MKDRLIELLQKADKRCDDTKRCEDCIGFGKGSECVNYNIADYLIANGIIVPPCKIGDTVYFIHQGCVLSGVVQSYENGHYVEAWVASYRLNFDILNKSVFLTQEEAEAALERRNG